jgi:5-methylcytosine-specific restriction endonuclease McrA
MRPGGEKRGNNKDRRARKLWMLSFWGDGSRCPCVHCDSTLTFETVEADRINPGGSYRRTNVQPACRSCNAARSNNLDWQYAAAA